MPHFDIFFCKNGGWEIVAAQFLSFPMAPVQFSAMQCVQSLVYSIKTNCDWMGGIDKVRSEVDLSADGETVLGLSRILWKLRSPLRSLLWSLLSSRSLRKAQRSLRPPGWMEPAGTEEILPKLCRVLKIQWDMWMNGKFRMSFVRKCFGC